MCIPRGFLLKDFTRLLVQIRCWFNFFENAVFYEFHSFVNRDLQLQVFVKTKFPVKKKSSFDSFYPFFNTEPLCPSLHHLPSIIDSA